MTDALKIIIERVSNYELLNNIIPGSIYVILTEKLTSFKIQTGDFWQDIIVFYFGGLVIGRIGSLVVERFLKWSKKTQFEPHSDYVKAENKNKLVRELSTINNMYRTYTAVAMCLAFTVIFNHLWALLEKCDWSKSVMYLVGCGLLVVIFGKSYIKQTEYISSRVKTINQLNNEEKE